jgi:hypothetical protein
MESECSERIRRALRKQVRTSAGNQQGEKVFYKRPDSAEWKGPGTVIGQDGVVVFVRHGGTYVRVHQCRLQKAKNNDFEKVNDTSSNSDKMDNTSNEDTEIIQDEDDEVEQKEKLPRPKNIQVKIGQTIRFQTSENEDTFVCKILSRAGKATGRYKDWFNVEYTEPEEMAGKRISIDLEQCG